MNRRLPNPCNLYSCRSSPIQDIGSLPTDAKTISEEAKVFDPVQMMHNLNMDEAGSIANYLERGAEKDLSKVSEDVSNRVEQLRETLGPETKSIEEIREFCLTGETVAPQA